MMAMGARRRDGLPLMIFYCFAGISAFLFMLSTIFAVIQVAAEGYRSFVVAHDIGHVDLRHQHCHEPRAIWPNLI